MKNPKILRIVSIVVLAVCMPLTGLTYLDNCPRIYYDCEGSGTTSNGDCYYYTLNPCWMACNLADMHSEWECLTNSYQTSIFMDKTVLVGCQYTNTYAIHVESGSNYQAWNDDTECGGNSQ